jgi:hypothetical protein
MNQTDGRPTIGHHPRTLGQRLGSVPVAPAAPAEGPPAITYVDRRSAAGRELARVFADPDTYAVAVATLIDGRLAVKRNEGIWSPPLQVSA